MDLALRYDEASMLRRILTRYLSELRMEIVGTEDYEMRQELKREEAAIKVIIGRLDKGGVPA